MKKIAVITVFYNSSAVLPDFFHSLDRQTFRDFTLYAVDNASPDDSLEIAAGLSETVGFPAVFLRNAENGGIAQGNNIGIRAALSDGCEWVVLSNNDTVWQADTLAVLLEQTIARQATMGVPGITVHGTDRLWAAGGTWNRWRGGTLHYGHGKRSCRYNKAIPVDYAPTCCMLIRADVFRRIGLMDERFFIYYDDSDFVRRATVSGESLWFLPDARIAHKESASAGAVSPFSQYWLARNLLLFTHKHFAEGYGWYVLLVNLLILYGKRSFTFGREQWQASRQGLRDGLALCRKPQPVSFPEPVCLD